MLFAPAFGEAAKDAQKIHSFSSLFSVERATKGMDLSMRICTLASGSSGNAMLVCAGHTRVLLDAGISARRIVTALRCLDVEPQSLSGILVTHQHADHIAGIATLTKQLALPVYATAPTLRQLSYRIPFLEELIRPVEPGDGFEMGGLWVEPFSTPHDATGSVGYALSDAYGKMALATDLGHLTEDVYQGIRGANLLVAEANHDEDWVRSGPYPYYLKQRILGDQGHLSNEAGAALVRHAAEQGTRCMILAHLSAENNTPLRARAVSALHLSAGGIDPEQDVHLSVAPRREPGPMFEIGAGGQVHVRQLREGVGC